jgi:hypothetical protein
VIANVLHDFIGTMTNDNYNSVELHIFKRVHNMQEHRVIANEMQRFRKIRLHARAFARRKDDG